MDGAERVVSATMKTRLRGRASRLVPDRVKAELHRGIAEPGPADD